MLSKDEIIKNYVKYREDPWLFLTECVYTKDQVDGKNPIKLFPNKKYLKYVVRLWQNHPLLAIPKSRRMTISWTMLGLHVWDAIFHKGREIAFVSKKEDDSNELVEKAKFIFDNIPENKIPRTMLPKANIKFNELEFAEINSRILGFPQGADQLRQFTFSRIFGDESAFWEKAEKFYAATLPTIDGGGSMTMVSSPAPGFFKKLCFDKMDSQTDVNVSEIAMDYHRPEQGIRVWKNQNNKFLVLELHYTSDETKRHDGYKESLKKSMPLMEYLREYELCWDTFEGAPVYPEFSNLHVLEEKPQPEIGLPMLIGFDFGLTPACVIGQYQGDQLVIFKEYVENNMGIGRFADIVIPKIKMQFKSHSNMDDWIVYIDPAGLGRKDTDERTCAQELMSKGFRNINPGPVGFEERRRSVANFLIKMNKDGPCFRLYAKDCQMIYKGFQGGYRYPEKALEIEQTKIRPVKDAYSHPHDALQYLCSGVNQLVKKQSRQIPRPVYTITEKKDGLHGRY